MLPFSIQVALAPICITPLPETLPASVSVPPVTARVPLLTKLPENSSVAAAAVTVLPESTVIAPAAAPPAVPISTVEVASTEMPEGTTIDPDGGVFRTRPPSCTKPPFTASRLPL